MPIPIRSGPDVHRRAWVQCDTEKPYALGGPEATSGLPMTTPPRAAEDLKEMKVTIPAQLHLQLVQAKLLRGQPIHTTVREALRLYFEERG